MTKSKGILPYTPRRKWTDADTARLRELYPDMTAAECAARLGRSVKHVWNKAARLGIRKSAAFIARMAAGLPGRTRETRFQKGGIPWNKGLTGIKTGNPATGLRNYGWTTRFVPALSQLVAVAAWIKEWVTARRDEIGAADSSATSAADTATQMRDQVAAIRDEAQAIVTGDVINDGEISLVSTWSSSGIADKMHLAASAVYQHDSAGRIMSVLEALPGGTCLTEYVYAADGRVTSMVETMGGKRRITTYNYSGNIITDMAVSEVLI